MSWSAFSNNLTKDNKIRFAYSPALHTTFVCNGEDANLSLVDHEDMTLGTTHLSDSPVAKYPVVFGNRLYLLNCIVSGTKYPTRAYRSSTTDDDLTWDTDNEWFDFDDEIVGGGKVGNNLLVGCKNSCHFLTLNDQKFPISANGCISHESISAYNNYGFWGSRDGVYASTGGSAEKISLPIQKYWDVIPEANLANVATEVLGNYLYVYLGDITVDGEALTNVMFGYDILQNDWNRMSLGVECESLHKFTTTNGQELFMGDDNGKVYQLFTSETQDTGNISASFETHWDYGSGERILDDFRELWAFGEKLSGLKVSCKVDDRGWVAIGQLNGSTDVVKFAARGYRIKFLFQETSKNNLYDIYKISLGYEPAYEK